MGLVSIIDAVFRRSTRPSSNSTDAANFKKFCKFFHFKSKSSHIELGAWGERKAARELRRRGFKILYRNYRGSYGGEIDLVCRDQEILVFVEVKTRSHENHSRPFDAVDHKKRKRLQQGALSWLRLLGRPDLTFRFDVVEVIASKPPEIRVIENAFNMPSSFRY